MHFATGRAGIHQPIIYNKLSLDVAGLEVQVRKRGQDRPLPRDIADGHVGRDGEVPDDLLARDATAEAHGVVPHHDTRGDDVDQHGGARTSLDIDRACHVAGVAVDDAEGNSARADEAGAADRTVRGLRRQLCTPHLHVSGDLCRIY